MTRKLKLTTKLAAGAAAWMVTRALLRQRRELTLDGAVVAITGGSRGLGLVLARECIGRGAAVAICARDAAELDRARAELEQLGGRVHTAVCDVTSRDEVIAFITDVQDDLGPIDVLVNNAGVITVGPVERMAVEDYERAIATHVYGPLYATLAVLPAMQRRRAGRIVNIASFGGKVAVPHLAPYSASKFALVGMSGAMRQELVKDNIFVTTVCPGLMRTGSARHAIFRGQHEAEYTWFGLGASLPGVSMSAERAARQIVEAFVHGDAEVTLSIPARLAAKLAGLAPNFVQELGAVIGGLLPSAAGTDRSAKAGKDTDSPLVPSVLTTLGDAAARRNNEL